MAGSSATPPSLSVTSGAGPPVEETTWNEAAARPASRATADAAASAESAGFAASWRWASEVADPAA